MANWCRLTMNSVARNIPKVEVESTFLGKANFIEGVKIKVKMASGASALHRTNAQTHSETLRNSASEPSL